MLRRFPGGALAAIAVMAAGFAGCTGNRGSFGGELEAAKTELATAARRLFEVYEQRRMAAEPLTLDFMDRYCIASERLADAEAAVAGDDRAAAARALSAHVARMEEFESQLRSIRGGSLYMIAVVDYHLARARLRLAQHRAAGT